MVCSVFIRSGLVLVPTLAQTEAGYYMAIEPVEVATVNDAERFAAAVKRAISRGNPTIPTPTRATGFPEPVLHKYAKVKSESAFQRGCSSWEITKKEGVYQTEQWKKNPEGGWVPDPERKEALAQGTSLDDAVRRLVARVRESTG